MTTPTQDLAHQWPSHRMRIPPEPLEPTHRIVAPPSHHGPPHDHTTDDWGDDPVLAEDRRGGWFDGLRFVNQPPGSLRDQIIYAEEGAYTTRIGGPWRWANMGFAWFIAVPGLTICYLLAWALFTRLSRTITTLIVATPLFVVANDLPVVSLFIPDVLDVTSYWR